MIHFQCSCGNALFFETSICLQCGKQVGYDPQANTMVPLEAGAAMCRNGVDFAVCNWVVRTPPELFAVPAEPHRARYD